MNDKIVIEGDSDVVVSALGFEQKLRMSVV